MPDSANGRDERVTSTTFPQGFLWGATTGSHQTEGNNVASDWWAVENAKDSILPEPSGDAADSYHRWPEDMDLLAKSGLRDYRFGIEWSRVEPADGRISLAAVAHYQRMIHGARERGLNPMPTLFHFTTPLWFAMGGGWKREDAIERFLRYVDALRPVLECGVDRVETINEPNIVAVLAARSAGSSDLALGLPVPDAATTNVMIDLHRAIRMRLAQNHPHILTGWGVSIQDYEPMPGAEGLMRDYLYPREEIFIEASSGDDWIGVQTYTRGRIANVDGVAVPVTEGRGTLTQNGWEYYPEALGGTVRRVAALLPEVPIIVTENGIATSDDYQRMRYTETALRSLRQAMDDGADVRGYLHWSLLDNYEWGTYGPTFGLIAVDRQTFARNPKPSLEWLGSIAPAAARPDTEA